MLARYIPSGLRGTINRQNFFEGWFQKIYSMEHQASVVIIYGYATQNPPDRFGFIQILVPDEHPQCYYFPKQEVRMDPTNHIVRMGKNLLSTQEVLISTELFQINLRMSVTYPIRGLKNSMGYTYYIPNLPCYHAVLNPAHLVSGSIEYHGKSILLTNERGYLEKNWGTSFPQDYLWLHALDPNDSGVSVLFSYASIEWMGKSFDKHVGHIRFRGIEIDLRELRQVEIQCEKKSPSVYGISLISKTVSLVIEVISVKQVMFKGPNYGKLSRDILHHADSKIFVTLTSESHHESFQLIGNFEDIGSLFMQLS